MHPWPAYYLHASTIAHNIQSPAQYTLLSAASHLWAAGGIRRCLPRKAGHMGYFLGLAHGRSQIWTCSNCTAAFMWMVLPPPSHLLAVQSPYGDRKMSDNTLCGLLIAFLHQSSLAITFMPASGGSEDGNWWALCGSHMA